MKTIMVKRVHRVQRFDFDMVQITPRATTVDDLVLTRTIHCFRQGSIKRISGQSHRGQRPDLAEPFGADDQGVPAPGIGMTDHTRTIGITSESGRSLCRISVGRDLGLDPVGVHSSWFRTRLVERRRVGRGGAVRCTSRRRPGSRLPRGGVRQGPSRQISSDLYSR